MVSDVSNWPSSARKRMLDIVLSFVALILASPLLLLATVGIMLSDPGPVIFRQERVGRWGEAFVLLKLRTMTTDDTRDVTQSIRTGSTAIFAFGSLLRRLKLDELPQLLNVLQGDMSLIGPRPLPPQIESTLPDGPRSQRRTVRPGITGLAQVRCGRTQPWSERVSHDVEYATTAKPATDLKILAATLRYVLRSPDRV